MRTQLRADESEMTRIRMLEADMDRMDENIAELRAEMRAGFLKCEEDSDSLRKILTGLLVAIVTTSITIVATVVITAGSMS